MQTVCHRDNGRAEGRYRLRRAAGLYWLIDMEQPYESYRSPVPLNESGAELWHLIDSGASLAEICRQLCAKYDISAEQAHSDVCAFIEQLKTMQVDLEDLNEHTYDWRGEPPYESAHTKN